MILFGVGSTDNITINDDYYALEKLVKNKKNKKKYISKCK